MYSWSCTTMPPVSISFEAPAVVFGSPMDPVARDAGFIPDDGAALSCDAIEKSGLSDVGPAHDDYRGNGIGHDSP